MNLKPILLLAGSAFAFSAAVAATPAETAKKPVGAAVGPVAGQQAALAADKPQIGAFGFDEAGMDKSILPGDDFYGFANGNWAKTTPIPGDRSNYGSFAVLEDLSNERTHGILDEAAKDPSSKIGVAYATYLDTATIESKGLTPIQPWLNRIKALKSKAGYAALVAEGDRIGIGGPVAAYVGQDDKNPDVYAITIVQNGTNLPDRDYYLKPDAKLAEAKAAYQAHIVKMLTLAGEPNADARAKAIVDFETQIAQVSWTRIDSRDANKTYNKMTVAQLAAMAPGFDYATYLKGIGANVDSVIVAQPSAFTGIAKVVAAAPLEVLKDQLLVESLDEYAGVLPRKFDEEHFAFYGTILSGTPEQEVRWKRAVGFTSAALADDVSKVYVAKYFPPETKAAADQLVHNIIAAMDAPPSRPRSAIPASGTIIRICRSCRATPSATPCARASGATITRSASSASRSTAGNGA
jgi:putative endopeptidase